MCVTLNPSDIIEIIGIFASLITSITAIVISVKTLKQNSKMIEESTRPNIQIYPVYSGEIVYIIIKNFGSSEAILDSIHCDHEFIPSETLGDDLGTKIFDSVNGALFSPGYSIQCPLIAHAVANATFNFKIKYHSTTKTYESAFSFNPYTNFPFANLHPHGKSTDEHLYNISKELRDIVKNSL